MKTGKPLEIRYFNYHPLPTILPRSLAAPVNPDERRCSYGDKEIHFPKQDTQAYQLLELTAICGELPAGLLPRLPGSISYKETIIWFLKKNRLLRTYYRDKLRGYRLGPRAKTFLLAYQPERFSFYLTGNADTNMLKSEISRRLRLHRIAETYVLMQNAGVAIFRDIKPRVFVPDSPPFSRLEVPAFYNSREIKELGIETVKIRGSRMIGVLLAPSGVFLTYNSCAYTNWDYRAEQRAQALLQMVICQQRLSHLYARHKASGLLLGNGMEAFVEILSSADSNARCFFLLDGNYEHFYYLTNDYRGEVILKLLCDPDKTMALNCILSQGLRGREPSWPVENDAISEDGTPVLFGYFLDIPRINRFLTALQLQKRAGTLICFDFQSEPLRCHCGSLVTLQTISFEKFERSFFHRQA